MKSVSFDRERGQILVQVAIMMGVLLAFVALAVDAGQVYGGRRRMQNAADAGALAGARAICSPTDGLDAEDAARDYAERNGADETPYVSIEHGVGYTVTVVATQTLDTFFAGVIGISTADVEARAAAVCGPLVVGPSWPLAFDYNTWVDNVGCKEDDEGNLVGDTFVVWDLSYDKDGTCVADEDSDRCNPQECDDGNGDNICEKYNCGVYGPAMGTGNYNWLALPADFPDSYSLPDDPACKGQPTGASWLKCWLEHKYPPVLRPEQCVSTEPGGVVAAEGPVTDLVDSSEDAYRNIILWDEYCTDDDGTGRSGILIRALGCIEVLDYHGPGQKDRLEVCQCGDEEECETEIAITAKRICEGEEGWDACNPPGGIGGGTESQVWGVSLVE